MEGNGAAASASPGSSPAGTLLDARGLIDLMRARDAAQPALEDGLSNDAPGSNAAAAEANRAAAATPTTGSGGTGHNNTNDSSNNGALLPAPYVIPAIVLLPSKVAEDGTAARRTPPITDASRCTTLRKPLIFSKLLQLLGKAFQTALFGGGTAPPSSAPFSPAHALSPLPCCMEALKATGAPVVSAPAAGGYNNGGGVGALGIAAPVAATAVPAAAAAASHHSSPLRHSPQCALGGAVTGRNGDNVPGQMTLMYHRPAQPSSRAKQLPVKRTMLEVETDDQSLQQRQQRQRQHESTAPSASPPALSPDSVAEDHAMPLSTDESLSVPGSSTTVSSAAAAASFSASPSPSPLPLPSNTLPASLQQDLVFARQHPLRILVVEDNSVNARLVIRMLACMGYGNAATVPLGDVPQWSPTASPTGSPTRSAVLLPPSQIATAPTASAAPASSSFDASASRALDPSLSVVDQVWNGAEAVELVVQQRRHYDLILLDSFMPVMTGPQACQAILAHYDALAAEYAATVAAAMAAAQRSSSSQAGTPPPPPPSAPVIIALSASCMESDREAARVAGHADFLPKPLSMPMLRAKLRQWAPVASKGCTTTQATNAGI
jgi:CheY-like chemotaxis protein